MKTPPFREYLRHDPATGLFTWIKSPRNGICVGDIAGCRRADGYRTIQFRGRIYLGHRLAWWFEHGDWPPDQIDHRNQTPGQDGRLNLRAATGAQNQHNRGPNRNNTSGYKGVSFHKRAGKWRADIMADRKQSALGLFSTAVDAARAYDAAARSLHGEFARLNFPDSVAA